MRKTATLVLLAVGLALLGLSLNALRELLASDAGTTGLAIAAVIGVPLAFALLGARLLSERTLQTPAAREHRGGEVIRTVHLEANWMDGASSGHTYPADDVALRGEEFDDEPTTPDGRILVVVGDAYAYDSPRSRAEAAARIVRAAISKTAVAVLLLVAAAPALFGCTHQQREDAKQIIVDCLGENQEQIADVVADMVKVLPDVDKVEQLALETAVDTGSKLGSCALAHVVQDVFAPAEGKSAPSPAYGEALKNALQRARARDGARDGVAVCYNTEFGCI